MVMVGKHGVKGGIASEIYGDRFSFSCFLQERNAVFYNLGDRRRLSIWTAHLSKDTIEPLVLRFQRYFGEISIKI